MGVQIGGEAEQRFSVNVGYSDPRREVSSISFTLRYIATNDVERTITWTSRRDTPESQGRLYDIEPGRYLAEAKLALPTDAKFDPHSGVQTVLLDITACDNGGAATGNTTDNSCWRYKNLRYVLRQGPTKILISAPAINAATTVADAVQAWLPTDRYAVTRIAAEPTVAQLDSADVLVLVTPQTATQSAAVKAFAERGSSVLILGEHAKHRQGAGANGYAQAFGFELNQDNLLVDCDTAHQAVVPSSLNQQRNYPIIPTGVIARLAGTNTLRALPGNNAFHGLVLPNGKVVMIVIDSTDPIRPERVAILADSNIWGTCGYSANREFHDALFSWLSRRS